METPTFNSLKRYIYTQNLYQTNTLVLRNNILNFWRRIDIVSGYIHNQNQHFYSFLSDKMENEWTLNSTLAQIFTALRDLNSKLDDLAKKFADQETANNYFQSELENLRSFSEKVDLLLKKPKNGHISPGNGPTGPKTPAMTPTTITGSAASKHAPASLPTTSTPAIATPANEWVQVVASRRPKTATSERKWIAAARAFQPPRPLDAPSGYAFVYIPRSRRMDRKEIRKLFSKLGIENSSISFPARSVIGVLVHQEFKQELIDTIIGSKGQITKDFNPLAHEHIVDPQYNNLAVANRTRLAKAFHQDRCIRTLYFVRPYLVPSVAKYFIQQNWITDVMASDIIAERLPRPLKRGKSDPASTANTFLHSIGHANASVQSFGHAKLTAPPHGRRIDGFGQIIEDMDIEVTEEFASNAYDDCSDSESDIDEQPAPVTTQSL